MMKVLMSALQDSLTFLLLLGAQVIVVASLAVTALWLYFKRVRNQAIAEAGLEEESADKLPETSESLNSVNEVHLALIRDLEAKVSVLEKEKIEMASEPKEQILEEEKRKNLELTKINQQTSEKIKEMEGKLLEYEVIKHEIGLLAQVKLENEKLKSTVSELEQNLSNLSKTKAPETLPETGPVEVFKPMETIAATQDPGIEGLLSEIEALTSEKKELQRKKA